MMEIEQIISGIIGEGVHTCLRRCCESYAAHKAHIAIHEMPDSEWAKVCDTVAPAIVKALAEMTPDEIMALTPEEFVALLSDRFGVDCPLGPCYQCDPLTREKCDWNGTMPVEYESDDSN